MAGPAAAAPSIQFAGGVFKLIEAPPPPPGGWASVFTVYAGSGNVPALLGSYSVQSGAVIFRPRYPIAPGLRYRAVFKGAGAPVEAVFNGPPPDTKPSAHVEHVYPSADILPSNQLRLFIVFSAPMSRGEAARHLRIVDARGRALEGADAVFLPGEELWDPSFRRLTLTFDPGRIKRGLTSNRKIGPPIAPGKRYSLIIDRDWPDASGVPMVEGYRKNFRGGPALRVPPDPKTWRLDAPRAGGRDPVVLTFPTPMSFPLLQRMIQVSSAQGSIAGSIAIDKDETVWRFTPAGAWKPGAYRLVVDTGLEDLAGNHIGQPFDIDVFQRVTEHITTNHVYLPFTLR